MSSPVASGSLVKNGLIEVKEEESATWYPARIVKLDGGRRVKIHYLNWHSRYDEWLSCRSPRLRALSARAARKILPESPDTLKFKVGQVIEAKWIDKHFYPGTVLSDEGDGYYKVLFSDGFKKKLKASNIRYVNENKSRGPSSESDISHSSKASSDKQPEGDETPVLGRSKRTSARYNRSRDNSEDSRSRSGEKSKSKSTEGSPAYTPASSAKTSPVSTSSTTPSTTPINTGIKTTPRIKQTSKTENKDSDKISPKPKSEKSPPNVKKVSPQGSKEAPLKPQLVVDPKLDTAKQRVHTGCEKVQADTAPTENAITKPQAKTDNRIVSSKASTVQPQSVSSKGPSRPPMKSPGPESLSRHISISEQKSLLESMVEYVNNNNNLLMKPPVKHAPVEPPKKSQPPSTQSPVDHISQVQKNQRDQSARMSESRGQIKGGTGYSPILPNLKSSNQAVYMQQSGMYSGAGPQFYPAGNAPLGTVWGVPAFPPSVMTDVYQQSIINKVDQNYGRQRGREERKVLPKGPRPIAPADDKAKMMASKQVGEQKGRAQLQMEYSIQQQQLQMMHKKKAEELRKNKLLDPRLQQHNKEGEQSKVLGEVKDDSKTMKRPLKRPPDTLEHKQARKIVKKSGSQAEVLKKISFDVYDFPMTMDNKNQRGKVGASSKEADPSDESDSTAPEDESRTPTPPAPPIPVSHSIQPPPYYLNYQYAPRYDILMQPSQRIAGPALQPHLMQQMSPNQRVSPRPPFQPGMQHPIPPNHSQKIHNRQQKQNSPSKTKPPAHPALDAAHHLMMQQRQLSPQQGHHSPLNQSPSHRNVQSPHRNVQSPHGHSRSPHAQSPHPPSPHHIQSPHQSPHQSAQIKPPPNRSYHQAIENKLHQSDGSSQTAHGEAISFRGLLDSEDIATTDAEKRKQKQQYAGQQPQAYISVMKLNKSAGGAGPMVESYPVHGNFKSYVPRITKSASPKSSRPGSPAGAKGIPAKKPHSSPNPAIPNPKMYQNHPAAQIQKVSNPSRLPLGFEMQQPIYRYPHPGQMYPIIPDPTPQQHHPHQIVFKPVMVPPQPNKQAKPEEVIKVSPNRSTPPKQVPITFTDQPKPDCSISAAIQDHLTSGFTGSSEHDMYMTDEIDISDLADYLDGGSNSVLPDDLIEQKAAVKTLDVVPGPEPVHSDNSQGSQISDKDDAKNSVVTSSTSDGTISDSEQTNILRKSIRERRASTKLLESSGGGPAFPVKITVSAPLPTKPNTITVLPAISELPASTTPSTPKKHKTSSLSEIHSVSPSVRRSSPPGISKGVPTSPLKQKLQQYILERQARQAANQTPPRTFTDQSPNQRSPGAPSTPGAPGSLENPHVHSSVRRMSQSPSPTSWQQLFQYGRNSPGFIASLSPRSRSVLLEGGKDRNMTSPYYRNTSPIPQQIRDSVDGQKVELKMENLSPNMSKSPRNILPSTSKSEDNRSVLIIPGNQIRSPKSNFKPVAVKEFVEPKILPIKQEADESPVTKIRPPPQDPRTPTDPRLVMMAGSKAVGGAKTPEGGPYNTRKIKVPTLALLGKKEVPEKKPKKPSDIIKQNVPIQPKIEQQKPSEPKPPQQPILIAKTPEKAPVSSDYSVQNPFQSTSSSSELISPFKDVISSTRHIPLPSNLMLFDEIEDSNLFMEEEPAKVEQKEEELEVAECPPMRMDLDGPLLEDLPYHSPHSKRESDPGEPTSGEKRGRGRPRSKSTITPSSIRSPIGDKEDGALMKPRVMIQRSSMPGSAECRVSKRARSSSEPISQLCMDEERSKSKLNQQYYYYGEPKAIKAIEPTDDHYPFKCNICNKGFPKETRLETHLKHYHEGKDNVAPDVAEEVKVEPPIVHCTCLIETEGSLMLQCDRCSCWVHGECVGVDVNDIPDQYICAFCYAIMKQGIDWYYDGNLPTIVPTDEKLKDEKMLLLHNMCDQYHEISKGLMATTLKLDSLVRSDTKTAKKPDSQTWTNAAGRKMDGTLVVIPGGQSVLLPNSTAQQTVTEDGRKQGSLVYVLSPGAGKTSAPAGLKGKTVYTVNRPPFVMSLSQLRQQNPGLKPQSTNTTRGQFRPVSSRPTFRPQHPIMAARVTTPGQTRHINNAVRAGVRSPGMVRTPTRNIIRANNNNMVRGVSSKMLQGPRAPGSNPRFNTQNVRMMGHVRSPINRPSTPRSPMSSPHPAPSPGTSPAGSRSEPATTSSPQPTFASAPPSRSSSPRLTGPRSGMSSPRLQSGQSSPRIQSGAASPLLPHKPSQPGSAGPSSPRKGDNTLLIQSVTSPISSTFKHGTSKFQDTLLSEISESQDLLESHITALEQQLDILEKECSDHKKGDPTVQLRHVLYDLEQLKILTQTV